MIILDRAGYPLARTQGELIPMQVSFLKHGYRKFFEGLPKASGGWDNMSATDRYRRKRALYDYPPMSI